MAVFVSANSIPGFSPYAAKRNSSSAHSGRFKDPFLGEANSKSLARSVISHLEGTIWEEAQGQGIMCTMYLSRATVGLQAISWAKGRVLPFKLLTVGKNKSTGVQMVVQEYVEKLRRYCSVEYIQVRSNPKKTSDVKAQIEGEGIKAMQHIMPKDWVVLLDENGKDITSEQLANLIGDTGTTGASAIVFCIGGPYGHGQQLRMRADITIRLSSMVLNHQIAFIVLVEQLYRAWTILKGQKYHHQ